MVQNRVRTMSALHSGVLIFTASALSLVRREGRKKNRRRFIFLRCLQRAELWSGVFSAWAVKISEACLPKAWEAVRVSSRSPDSATHTHTHAHTHAKPRACRHSSAHSFSGGGRLPQPSPLLAFTPSPCFFCPFTPLSPSSSSSPTFPSPPSPQTTSILGFGKAGKTVQQTTRQDGTHP